VRQLVSDTAPDAKVTLTREYSPYGEIVSQSGTGNTEYGFTGELQDGGLVHLRARDYTVADGRFLSRDSWEGDVNQPTSYNKWSYANANPVRFSDPTGYVGYDRLSAVEWAKRNDRDNSLALSSIVQIGSTFYQTYNFEEIGASLCAVFASMALWEGGERDKRKDPLSLMGHDYPLVNWWNKEALILDPKDPSKQFHPNGSKGLYITNGPESPWSNVGALYNFFAYNHAEINAGVAIDSTNIPQFVGDVVTNDNSEWNNLLEDAWNKNTIQPGDLVFYMNDGSSNWDHVAIVVGWGIQSKYTNEKIITDPAEILAQKSIHCGSDFVRKPRVIEKSGEIMYESIIGRSIDNTAGKISRILALHLY